MSTKLETDLRYILADKINNIIPGNIKSGVTVLGVAGSVVPLNGQTKTVTPTTSSQTITPDSGYNGITQVNVNAVTSAIDNNIIAGNIKNNVTILGVTGNYQGNVPSGTISITSNGTVDVSSYATADVSVSSGGSYNAKMEQTSYYSNGVRDIITEVDMNGIVLQGNCNYFFQAMSNLVTVLNLDTSDITGFNYFFRNCAELVNIPQLDFSSGTSFSSMFDGATKLSADSLNGIMASCIGATNYSGNKTLANMGLTSRQCAYCKTYSNYSAFVAAGWSTGY